MRCALQSFAIGIFAHGFNDGAVVLFHEAAPN